MDTFATPRLKATKLAREDLPDLVRLHLDGEVSRFLGGVRTPAVTATYLETNLRHWTDHGIGLWTLRTDDGTFMGRAGLRRVELEGVAELELAYTFVRSAWGQGLATEIARAPGGDLGKAMHRAEPRRHRHEGQPGLRTGSLEDRLLLRARRHLSG